MKRIRLAIIILAVVVLIAGAIFGVAYFFNDKAEKEAAANKDKLNMFSFDNNYADKVEISNESGEYVAEFDSEQGWHLTNTDEIKLNDTAIASMATSMSALKATKILEGEDPSKYGFDNPSKVTVYVGDEAYTVLIGDPTPTYENYYAMKENDDNIYLIEFTNGAVLSATRDELKNTYLFTYSTYEVTHFAFWQGKQTDDNILFSMKKGEDDNWSMEKPYADSTVYYTQIDEFLTGVSKDQVFTFVQEGCPESEYSKFGFDNPQYVFEVSAGDDTTTLIFGDSINNDEEMYGLFVESGQVVTLASSTISLLNYTTLDMMNTSVFTAEIKNVAEVNVTLNDTELLLSMSGGEDSYMVNNKKVSEIGETAKSAFVSFYNSFNNAYFDATEKTAEPSGKPAISIKYAETNNIVTLIEYIPVPDSDTYYAIKNGEYTGFIVTGEIIDTINKSYDNLMKEIGN